jgi:predicted site-specific integrase-resolvase
LGDAGLNPCSKARFGGRKALAKAVRVERGDLEDAVATLRAARTAGKVRPGALYGGRYRLVEDLQERSGLHSAATYLLFVARVDSLSAAILTNQAERAVQCSIDGEEQ